MNQQMIETVKECFGMIVPLTTENVEKFYQWLDIETDQFNVRPMMLDTIDNTPYDMTDREHIEGRYYDYAELGHSLQHKYLQLQFSNNWKNSLIVKFFEDLDSHYIIYYRSDNPLTVEQPGDVHSPEIREIEVDVSQVREFFELSVSFDADVGWMEFK